LSFERTGTNAYPPAVSRVYLAWCLAELGEFDRAIALAAEALPIAEATGHVWTILMTHWAAFPVYLRRGDFAQATVLLERIVSLAQASAHPMRFLGYVNLAAINGLLGRADEARQHLDAWRIPYAAVQGQVMPHVPLLLPAAEAALIVGHPDEARELADQVVELTRARGHPGFEAAGLHILGGDRPPERAARRGSRRAGIPRRPGSGG